MKTKLLAASALALFSLCSQANEGQWQPAQLAQLGQQLDAVGIRLDAQQLANPLDFPLNAVISMGYCSGAFVSPNGLILTNHHCGYGMIQHNSTAANNLIEKGFIAKAYAEELPGGPQERIYVTRAIDDVTQAVLAKVGQQTGKARFDAIEEASKALIKDCETDAFTRCQVRSFHGGLSYQRITQTMFKDVRLVYAPPEAIGKFGGDTDNFEWPRHTGDFSVLRVYVGPDGKPAEYSPDNKPYHSKHFLHINAQGVREGDGILLAGYPGSTSRYRLASEVNFAKNWTYPTQAADYRQTLAIINQQSQGHPEWAVAYASTVASFNNRMKKLEGLIDGFKQTDIAAIKAQKEAALPSKAHLEALESALKKAQPQWQRQWYQALSHQSALLDATIRLYRNALERQKPDADRKAGFQDRDQAMLKAGLERLQSRFVPPIDQAIWQAKLGHYLASDYRDPALDAVLPLANGKPALDALYQHTALLDAKARLALLDMNAAAFAKSQDPMVKLAVALTPQVIAAEDQEEALDGELSALRPAYMQDIIAYNEARGLPVYPDANSTLRVTFGTVAGYQPRDAVYYGPFTSVDGILQKEQDSGEFAVPEALKAAIKDRRFGQFERDTLSPKPAWYCTLLPCPAVKPFNSVPVAFLSSADTTGGNSGSPVMDGQGRLVGLNFDSTYESITKDWYFNPQITRAIHVDMRYVLWLLESVYPAPNLLDEMVIERE